MFPKVPSGISYPLLRRASLCPQLTSVLVREKRNYASGKPVDFSEIKIPKEHLATGEQEYFGAYRAGHDETFGDYPALKWIAYDQKDPYAEYDDPCDRRNFGEIVHAEDEILSAHGPSTFHPEPLTKAFLRLFGVFGALASLWFLAREAVKHKEIPVAPTDYDFPDYIGNKELERLVKERSLQ